MVLLLGHHNTKIVGACTYQIAK